jgi:hypothetical protein
MGSFSNVAENQILNYIFRNITNSPIAAPTAWYAALHNADPTEDGSVGELAVANGYQRKSVTFNAPVSGAATNVADVIFGPCVTSAWGSGIGWISIWDALSSGNMLIYGGLSASVTVQVGDSVKVATPNLIVAID